MGNIIEIQKRIEDKITYHNAVLKYLKTEVKIREQYLEASKNELKKHKTETKLN